MKMLIITGILMLLFKDSTEQAIIFPNTSLRSCTTDTGERGWCQKASTCSSPLKKELPKPCGFDGETPLLCCPDSKRENITSRLLDSEVAPPNTNFKCGERGIIELFTSRKKRNVEPFVQPQNETETDDFYEYEFVDQTYHISSGVTSFMNSWPWMVLLGRNRSLSPDFFCSGVVINANYIITAAHCVLEIEPIFARLGEHDYDPLNGFNLDEVIEDIGIQDRIFHPNYDLNKGYYDIALLKLNTPTSFNNQVQPICLPWGPLVKEVLIDEEVTIAGWGDESFGGLPSTVLKEVNVTVFHPSVCEKSYSTLKNNDEKFPDGLNQWNIICAGDIDGKKDSCQGDSGGPMMHYNAKEGTFNLAGIISNGFGCGHKEFPGLYAPLRNYDTLKWIKDTAF